MKNRVYIYSTIIFLVLLVSCGKEEGLFTELEASYTNVTFTNTIEEDDTHNILNFMNIYTGAGVGVGDLNNDGFSDIFFAGNMVPSKLYINKGDFVFEDITESSGIFLIVGQLELA